MFGLPGPGWLWALVVIAIVAFVGNALGIFTITFDVGFKLGR